jgi:hypothetical protein
MCSKPKVVLLIFFDYKGTVYHEFAVQGHTKNHNLCLTELRCLCDAVVSQTAKKSESSELQICCDIVQLVWQFLAEHSIP